MTSLSVIVHEQVTLRDIVAWAKRAVRKARRRHGKPKRGKAPVQHESDRNDPARGPPDLGISVSDDASVKDIFGRR